MADTSGPTLRRWRGLGILFLVLAIAPMSAWVSRGISGLSDNTPIGAMVRPESISKITSLYASCLGILGVWTLFPSTAKSLGLPHIVYGATLALFGSVAMSLTQSLALSRGERLGWVLASTAQDLLVTCSAPVLWGCALAQRSNPEHVRALKLTRISAQSLLVSFVLSVGLNAITVILLMMTPPLTPSSYMKLIFGQSGVFGQGGLQALVWIAQSISQILLLWTGFDALRKSMTPIQVRRRATRIHLIVLTWTLVSLIATATGSVSGIVIVKARAMAMSSEEMSYLYGSAAYAMWVTAADLSVVSLMALVVADFLTVGESRAPGAGNKPNEGATQG
jgi:hypothetical protein